jgi:hypothetical protein
MGRGKRHVTVGYGLALSSKPVGFGCPFAARLPRRSITKGRIHISRMLFLLNLIYFWKVLPRR